MYVSPCGTSLFDFRFSLLLLSRDASLLVLRPPSSLTNDTILYTRLLFENPSEILHTLSLPPLSSFLSRTMSIFLHVGLSDSRSNRAHDDDGRDRAQSRALFLFLFPLLPTIIQRTERKNDHLPLPHRLLRMGSSLHQELLPVRPLPCPPSFKQASNIELTLALLRFPPDKVSSSSTTLSSTPLHLPSTPS